MLLTCFLVASCERPASTDGPTACDAETTPIFEIQGDQFTTPLLGQRRTVQGVVTRVQGDGFYLESPLPAPDRHSRAIFISPAQDGAAVYPGQQLQLGGQVAETGSGRDTMTSLSAVTGVTVCAEASDLPVTQVALPMKPGAREALEGMRLVFDQRFTLTDPVTVSQG